MMRSVTSFIQVTWKIHVRILRPIVVRESALPLTIIRNDMNNIFYLIYNVLAYTLVVTQNFV